MNLDLEYNECIKKFHNEFQGKSVCNFYVSKMRKCKTVCDTSENQRQEQALKKCIDISKTDNQLESCIKQNIQDATINICKIKCELTAINSFKTLYE
jgi:hypothetical protein